MFRLARHVRRRHGDRSPTPDELLEAVREKFPDLSDGNAAEASAELRKLLGRVDHGKQTLVALFAEADAADDPPEAARYAGRPRLRHLLRLILLLPRNEHDAVTLAQQPLADLFSIRRQSIDWMIRVLVTAELLTPHTPARRGNAASYIPNLTTRRAES